MTAIVGPPPGLAAPKPDAKHSDTHESTSIPASSSITKAPAPIANRYETRFMLALSSSPLVAPPSSMPVLSQWYGDWEPYHFRAPHGSQAHGLPYSPMGSIGSGTRAERHGRGGAGGDHQRDRERNGEEADGYHGGVMRDGGLITSRRDQQGAKYRSKFEDRDPDMIKIDKRYPATGKNPFGQVSASGTFKPAGKDGLEGGKYSAGRKDRDMPLSAYSDDRNRGTRNGRDPRDRRRGGVDDAEDDEEWESVPKSPENERRSKASLGEGAMEWRRTTGKLPGKGSLPTGRERERETGRKTSFPAWMAEESEPSWMSEGQDDSQQYQMGGRDGGSSSRADGGRDGGARSRMHDDDEIDIDTSGMDGIQAFKAQMKERERRERDRQHGGTAQVAGPPPGLEKRTESDEHDTNRDGMAALHSVGMNQQDKSAAALFDNFASSAKQRQQEKQQQQMQQHHDIQGATLDSRGESDIDQVLPSRSSRFARFFDGKPQAAALAAQQKQMESSQRVGEESGKGSVRSPASPPAKEHGTGNLADLFRGMSTEKSHLSETNSGPALAAPPGLQKNPSDADVQSMQKIMALLSSGGIGEAKGQDGQSYSSQQGRPPGPPPSMPPGINVSAGGQERDREAHHPGGQSGSPASLLQHVQSHQQPPGSWASALTSPRQHFDSHVGSFPTSPPPSSQQNQQGQQQQSQQAAPFRPPFGIDPRLLARGPPPPQGMPPQFGSPPPPPPGAMGRGGMPPSFGIPSFPSGVRPPPPMPPLPPQLQQHMMTLPPQAQHQLLMQHLQHHGLAHNAFAGPPPQQSSQQQQHHHHMAGPHSGGNGGTSPLPPFMSPSPASPNANQSAQLMALLGQGRGGNSSAN